MKNHKHWGIDESFCFERNNYFYAKLMTVRDFVSEQQYFNEKRWLINRMVNGWGVVAGLEVQPIWIDDSSKTYDCTRVLVTPGMALDFCGREILVSEEQVVSLTPEEPSCPKSDLNPPENKFWICIEYCECQLEPVSLPPNVCYGTQGCEYNRIKDSFRIMVKRPLGEAGEPARECLQFKEKCRSLHDKLCEKLKEDYRDCPDERCLVLAEITITSPEQMNPCIKIDQCSKRKLVYNNPLLYDLIHCYHEDLPHIVDINWKHDYEYKWDKWAEGPLKEGLQVIFDQEMDGSTINKHTFTVMTKIRNEETDHFFYKQVPGEITYENRTATFAINNNLCVRKGSEYMVILRGDFIMSDPGDGTPARALDANFIGGELPSGNGIQGDDFVSWFTVELPSDIVD